MTRAYYSLGFFFVALWVYSPCLNGTWLFDDYFYFPDNDLLRQPNRLWYAWFAPGSFVEYYPVLQTVECAEWNLWHERTIGYHLVNILGHGATAVLLSCVMEWIGLRRAAA
jgi:hypothetical protein